MEKRGNPSKREMQGRGGILIQRIILKSGAGVKRDPLPLCLSPEDERKEI